MDGSEWKRLANLVVNRRVELGMRTTKAFAERAQITARALGDIENARRTNYSSATKAAIEQALDWMPGSIDMTIAGGDPVPIVETSEPLGESTGGHRLRVITGDGRELKMPILEQGVGRVAISELNKLTRRLVELDTEAQILSATDPQLESLASGIHQASAEAGKLADAALYSALGPDGKRVVDDFMKRYSDRLTGRPPSDQPELPNP